MRTNKRQNSGAAPMDFALIGRVKVGQIVENQYGKKMPTSLDYFRFATYGETGSKRYVELAEQAYPHSKEKPRKEIIITFPSDSDSNCDNFYILRSHEGKEIARTDMSTVIRLSMTETWAEWAVKNANRLSKPPQNSKDAFLYIHAEDFGTGDDKIAGDFQAFCERLKASAYKRAIEAKSKSAEQVDWKEILVLRFVLLNYPVQGRWELQTAATKTSISELLAAYDAVKQARGSVVGVHFVLQCQKVKSNRDGVARQYTTISMAPLITPEQLQTGSGLLINSITTVHQGIKLIDSPEIQVDSHDDYAEFTEE